MGFRYTHNHAAFGELVLNAEFMVAEMRERAERAAEFARGVAPVDEQGPHPGRYRDSIHVESGTHGGADGNRAYGSVVADAPESVYVEFGTEHSDGQHVIARSLDVL